MKLKHFTPEEMEEIATFFGLSMEKIQDDYLPVIGGYVSKSEKVWWKHVNFPELVDASEHWSNIRLYPHVYSLEMPGGKFVYDT